jgi:hypothetical protein
MRLDYLIWQEVLELRLLKPVGLIWETSSKQAAKLSTWQAKQNN